MAGTGSSLDDLYNTFMGQTTTALNGASAPDPWQQELMASVNPEKVRRDNIMKALATASQALATTPGNFLTGLSAAAGAGANSYLTAKSDAEQNHLKAMQIAQAAQRQAEDRRLQLLSDAFGVGRQLQSDKRQEAETTYQHGRDTYNDQRNAEKDALAKKEAESRIAYYDRRSPSGVDSTGMTSGQVLTTKRAIRREIDSYEKQLREPGLGDPKSEDEIQRLLEERKNELEDYYGITLDDSAQTVAPGETNQVVNKQSVATPVPGAKRGKPLPADLMQQARDAINRGANAQAVRQRLIDNGYDVTGL